MNGNHEMKNTIFWPAALGIALLFSSCIFINTGEDFHSSSFDYTLRGTWERTNYYTPPGGVQETVKGQLVIGHDRIEICGTGTIKTLENFARDIVLEAYSEDEKIHIKQSGTWQNPVSYTLWTAADKNSKMLTLTGNGSEDIFRQIAY
jgi:hypothetical protein